MMIAEIPPNSPKHHLVRNRIYDRLCATVPFLHLAEIVIPWDLFLSEWFQSLWGEYIGETARPLCDRVKNTSRENQILACLAL